MSESIWRLARSVVWSATHSEAVAAQERLWQATGHNHELYHHAIWQASLEKADYLRWERTHRQPSLSAA